MKRKNTFQFPINKIFNTCDCCNVIITKKNTTHRSFCNYCNSCYQKINVVLNSNNKELQKNE